MGLGLAPFGDGIGAGRRRLNGAFPELSVEDETLQHGHLAPSICVDRVFVLHDELFCTPQSV